MINNCKLIHHFLLSLGSLLQMKHWSSCWVCRFISTVIVIKSAWRSFWCGILLAFLFLAASCTSWPGSSSSFANNASKNRNSLHFHDSGGSGFPHRRFVSIIELTVSIWEPSIVICGRLSWANALLRFVLTCWTGLTSYIPGALLRRSSILLHHHVRF